jgi:hypothetical protein
LLLHAAAMLFSRLFQLPSSRGNERSSLLPGNDALRNNFVTEDVLVPGGLATTQDDLVTSRRRPFSGEGFDEVPESKRQLGARQSILVTRQFR